MSNAYLSLGSNLGDKIQHLNSAIAEIAQRCGTIVQCSSFYASAPWGFVSSNGFVNLVLQINTTLTADALLETTREIEHCLGRRQKTDSAYHDRIIDIDLLFLDELVIETEHLTLPHPRLHQRLFVLMPLAEIAPELRHPIFGINTAELLQHCKDTLDCVKLNIP